ncbi:hypothetical protein ACFQ0M_40435 [Kitasatospora aburaviensis]
MAAAALVTSMLAAACSGPPKTGGSEGESYRLSAGTPRPGASWTPSPGPSTPNRPPSTTSPRSTTRRTPCSPTSARA